MLKSGTSIVWIGRRIESLRVLVVVFVVVLPVSLGAQATTTQLTGRLTATDGSPIGGAEVTVAGSTLTARSDSAGRFLVETVPVGELRIQVRALGFAPLDTILRILPGASHSLSLTMARSVQQLAPVVTEAVLPFGKPLRYQHTGRFDDFYERRARQPGTFFTREDIERSGRNSLMELVSMAPGVIVGTRPGGLPYIRVARCVGNQIGQRGTVDLYKWLNVFINGRRVLSNLESLSELKADEIETLEVYRGPSQLPLEAIGDACAAVFITTRYTTGSVLPKK